jgi:hypothetical protein
MPVVSCVRVLQVWYAAVVHTSLPEWVMCITMARPQHQAAGSKSHSRVQPLQAWHVLLQEKFAGGGWDLSFCATALANFNFMQSDIACTQHSAVLDVSTCCNLIPTQTPPGPTPTRAAGGPPPPVLLLGQCCVLRIQWKFRQACAALHRQSCSLLCG